MPAQALARSPVHPEEKGSRLASSHVLYWRPDPRPRRARRQWQAAGEATREASCVGALGTWAPRLFATVGAHAPSQIRRWQRAAHQKLSPSSTAKAVRRPSAGDPALSPPKGRLRNPAATCHHPATRIYACAP
eukprot:scaffold312803_cov32-Tisochrysis_lutea.AAC.2